MCGQKGVSVTAGYAEMSDEFCRLRAILLRDARKLGLGDALASLDEGSVVERPTLCSGEQGQREVLRDPSICAVVRLGACSAGGRL